VVCLDQWEDSLSPNPRIEEGRMKKGDRVRFPRISIIFPPGAEGVLVKSYEYETGKVWKVLLYTHRGTEIRRVRADQLEAIK